MNEDAPSNEGLRERKKRELRQRISDVATGLFFEHGFDAVRVADIAEVCAVSEKTIYNYFPTKESLLLDREPHMIAMVRRALGPEAPPGSPVQAFVDELTSDLEQFGHGGPDGDVTVFVGVQRFQNLIESHPSLRAAQRDMMDRVTRVAAEELARRAGVDPTDPEPVVAAASIISLWGVQFEALARHGQRETASHDDIITAVSEEVMRGARLIETGLWSFGLAVRGMTSQRQLREAAAAARDARVKVVEAVTEAKSAWKQMMSEAHAMHAAYHGEMDDWGARGRGGGPKGRGGPRGRGWDGNVAATAEQQAAQVRLREAKQEVARAAKEVAKAKGQAKRATKKLKDVAKDAAQQRPSARSGD